jgi:hypothetical protein
VQEAARQVLMARLAREAHVVEIDATLEAPQPRLRFVTDKQKAALSGVSTTDIAQHPAMANDGYIAGYLQQPQELKPLPIELRLAPGAARPAGISNACRCAAAPVWSSRVRRRGWTWHHSRWCPLASSDALSRTSADTPIYRKDLRPGGLCHGGAQRARAGEVVADLVADFQAPVSDAAPSDWSSRTFFSNGGGDGWASRRARRWCGPARAN